jgi:TPR repeat protein
MYDARSLALSAAIGLLAAGCAGGTQATAPTRTAAKVEIPASAPFAAEPPSTEKEPEKPVPFHLPCADDDFAGCNAGCSDKHPEDCVTLGSMYLKGTGVTADQKLGVELLRAACNEGSARGCLKLGDAYHEGIVFGDKEEVDAYNRACDGGANLGCVAAAKAYLNGHGVALDPVLAAKLFRKVCERGNAPACFELGRLYKTGEGVPANGQRADELFEKACKLGLDEGCLVASAKRSEMLSPRE